MRQRSSLKRSHHHLKQLIEETVAEECRLSARGLAFIIDEFEVVGSPPERVKVWATLHFLPLGSPFCCMEPDCHLCLFLDRLERVSDALRLRMGLQQKVSIEFAAIHGAYYEGVEFDNCFTGRDPGMDLWDIDRRDALGRTALMRAAVRGHDHLVEGLLERGADPSVVDNRGRSILQQVSKGSLWIITLLEDAIRRRNAEPGEQTYGGAHEPS